MFINKVKSLPQCGELFFRVLYTSLPMPSANNGETKTKILKNEGSFSAIAKVGV